MSAATLEETVRTPCGWLRGVTTPTMLAYLGVPYAMPPTGERRWRSPEPMAPWDGERDARAFGPWCAQNVLLHGLGVASASEDCLYLNVFVPRAPRSPGPLPVMVWFHGGGLWCGRPHDYDPVRLVTEGQVIFVSVGYRLNVFGFFAHPEVAGDSEADGNYGIQDQQAALRWVQRCIGSFGGDPENVTIAGQSAGGRSVEAHLCSPTSAGLFHRAIVQSSSAGSSTIPAIAEIEAIGAGLVDELERRGHVHPRLRDVPAAAILEANTPQHDVDRQGLGVLGLGGPFTTGLMTDGVTLPLSPREALADGAFNRVPTMVGVTRNEGTWFVALGELDGAAPLSTAAYTAVLEDTFGPLAEDLRRAYPAEQLTPGGALAQILTDRTYVAGERRALRLMAPYNRQTYAYVFDPPGTPNTVAPKVSFGFGAGHMAELPYLFPGFRGAGGPGGFLDASQQALAGQMVAYWSAFARSGDPGCTDLPAWRPYGVAEDNYLCLTTPGPAEVTDMTERHHCALWDSVDA